MRAYRFKTELDALRIQLDQEHSLDVKYLVPSHTNIKPIQIIFGEFLKDKDLHVSERRDIRLSILSLFVEKNVSTTYDLTVYQCSTIANFLGFEYGEKLSKRTKRFLEDAQAHIEGRHISSPNISPARI